MNINKNKHLALYFIITSFFEILLQYVPLISDFSYEFAVINGAYFFLSFPFIFRSLFKNLGNKKNYKISIYFLSILMLPIIISFIYGNLLKCDFMHGLKFYLTITTFTSIYSLIFILSLSQFNAKSFYLVYFSVFILLSLQPIIELYYNPHIFFYNVIIGYFPGTIYDKLILIDNKFIFYRFLMMLPFLFILMLRKPDFLKIFILLLLFMLPIKFFFGFSYSFHTLKNNAKTFISDDNFSLYFYSNVSRKEARKILLEHEYFKHSIETLIGEKINIKINSFIFPNREIKRKFFGATGADIAKPWQYSIFTIKNDKNVKHELAHIYASTFSNNFLRIAASMNPALTEGFAVAAENNFYGYPIYEITSQLVKENIFVPIKDLFENFSFFGMPPALVYLYSGAFVKYLIDNYGIKKFAIYYSNGDFNKTYSLPIEKVSQNFYDFLSKRKTYSSRKIVAKYILGSQQIFRMKCPHFVAETEYYAKSLNRTSAIEKYKLLFEKYSSSSAFFNYIENLILNENIKLAFDYLKSNEKKFENTAYDLKFLDYKIKLLLLNERQSNIDKIADSLTANSPFLYFKVKSDFYKYISELSVDIRKNLLLYPNTLKGEKISEILERKFSSALFVLNLTKFTPKEIEQIITKNRNNFKWYVNYFLTDYFLNKQNVKKANIFALELNKNHPIQYRFQVKNLINKTSFFMKYIGNPH